MFQYKNENFTEKTFTDCSGPIIMWVGPQNLQRKPSQIAPVHKICRENLHRLLGSNYYVGGATKFAEKTFTDCSGPIITWVGPQNLQRKPSQIAPVQLLRGWGHKICRENLHRLLRSTKFAEKTFTDCSGPIIMWVGPQNLQRKPSQIAPVQLLRGWGHKICRENLHRLLRSTKFAEKTFTDCSGPIIMWVGPQNLQRKPSQIAPVQLLRGWGHKICRENLHRLLRSTKFAEKTFTDCSGPIIMWVGPQNLQRNPSQIAPVQLLCGWGHKICRENFHGWF